MEISREFFSFIKLCVVVLRLDRDKYIQNTVSWKYEYVFVLIFYFQLISPIFKTFFLWWIFYLLINYGTYISEHNSKFQLNKNGVIAGKIN